MITRRGFLGSLLAAGMAAAARIYPATATLALSGAVEPVKVERVYECVCAMTGSFKVQGMHTLSCAAYNLDPDGKIAEVAEFLGRHNPIFDDMAWKHDDGKGYTVML